MNKTVFKQIPLKYQVKAMDKYEFDFSDSFDYISKGMEAIVDDEVTKRFTAEELTVMLVTMGLVHAVATVVWFEF